MTMNEQQIGYSLLALTSALTEKLGRHPAIGPYLSVDDTGKCSIGIYADRINHYKCTDRATGDTFAEAIDAAWNIVNKIKSCEDDAKASLDEMLAEARLEGWRAGREAAADCTEDYCSDMPDLAGHGHSVGLRDAIRALPEPKEASHD